MARVIEIPFKPHAEQAAMIPKLKRFNVLVCHRRWGKSVLAINLLNRAALQTELRAPRFAYLAPLYKQAKAVAWDYIKHYARPIPGVTFNESELRVDYPNGGRLILLGADNPDSLRGIYLDGVVLDEVAQMPANLWPEVLRPALSDRKGWALFIGTPQGRDFFYDIHNFAKLNDDAGWFTEIRRASDTGIIDPDELSAAYREMGSDKYEQEFECSFTAAITGAYYGQLINQAEKAGRICSVPWEPTLPVMTAWDIGMSDSTAIWFIQALRGGEIRAIDYYEADGEGLDHYAKVLKEKGYLYSEHFGPHDLKVRELGTGKSRKEIAAGLGLNFTVVPNLPVQDGINCVRATIPKVWFDEKKCHQGLEGLRHYRRDFNEKMGAFKDNPVHDWAEHPASAFRYFALGYDEEVYQAKQKAPDYQQTAYNPFAVNYGNDRQQTDYNIFGGR